MTLTAFADPIDSAAIQPQHWLDIADAIVEHAPGHTGVVVLHGTDTMAYTAAALSFLLEGLDIPIVLTGAQRPITAIRSDGRENLVTAAAIALAQFEGTAAVPEVTIFFDDVLLRGNCSSKVHADSYQGFASPNMGPLAMAGVSIEYDRGAIRPRPAPVAALRRVVHRRRHSPTPPRPRRSGSDRHGVAARPARSGDRGIRGGQRPNRGGSSMV